MATPMIDDIELAAVQRIRQETRQDYVRQRIPGLEGELHQRLGRASHRVWLTGLLLPFDAAEDLKKLQQKASAGEEVTFTADITTALEVSHMVIEAFAAEQEVGPAGQIAYSMILSESPPLPPPAEVSAFGGLGDFGLGDLGFDPGALGDVVADIEAKAGELGELADAALEAVNQLQALSGLADLADLGNPIKPLADQVSGLAGLAGQIDALRGSAEGLAGGGGS
jgi:hypothetical protein